MAIPIDILEDSDLEARIETMLADGKRHQIALLSLWDFMRARGRSQYAKSIRTASLILTSSKMVVWGAKFLRHRKVPRYMPFDFVIRVLSYLEKTGKSIYLIGSKPDSLQKATGNLRGSFPGLHIVGRCAGYFPLQHEENILLAIRKSAPALVLAGSGIRGKDKWLLAHKHQFAPGFCLWCGDCIDIFSGKKKKTSSIVWNRGLDFIPELLRKPWNTFRIIRYCWFVFLLLYYRIRRL